MHSQLAQELQSMSTDAPSTERAAIGIIIQDAMNRRALEGASTHLDLVPLLLSPEEWNIDRAHELELIVADESLAHNIHDALAAWEPHEGIIKPAVIAVVAAGDSDAGLKEHVDHSFDGLLRLPQSPAQVAAQLSILLYAQRAFARRYQNAIEELQLNRRIFRSVTSGICVANATQPDMPLSYVNPAFEVMTGYSLEEIQGKNCRFLQGKDRVQPALTLIREAIRDGREVKAVLRNYRKDGSPFWNELSMSPIRNREGHLTHFVGIQTDVTARIEFESALRESEKLAAVGRLSASIAHEINNPLEAVMNLVYIAQGSDSLENTRELLASADRELRRVKLITSQSLRFYKQSTKAQAVTGADLLDPVLHIFESRMQNAGVSVERRDRTSGSIVCMESEIRQVFSNLIGNAIDAMQKGGGRLLIRSRNMTNSKTRGKGVLFTVADTGSGISPEALQNIYKAFFTTKGNRGTGLGLWISSEIVDRHHGFLKVRTQSVGVRTGTVFQMFLPLQGLSPVAADSSPRLKAIQDNRELPD